MRVFIDCGFYSGGALQIYLDKKIVNPRWKFYAFEPSPEVDVENQVAKFPKLKIELIKKAVWIKDGKIPFWTSNRHNSSHVDNTTFNARNEKIKVEAIDFSKFLAQIPEEAFVVCSMDIEGSEYKVLEKCIKDGTISRINVLDIEFHHRFMPEHTKIESQALIDKLEALGITVKLKVDLE